MRGDGGICPEIGDLSLLRARGLFARSGFLRNLADFCETLLFLGGYEPVWRSVLRGTCTTLERPSGAPTPGVPFLLVPVNGKC